MPFKKGQSGNLKGRPKGTDDKRRRFQLTHLMDAIESVEKERGVDFYNHVVTRAYENDKVLVAVLKKLIPDQMHQTISPFPDEFLEKKIKVINKNGSHVPERFQRFMYGQN